MTWNGGQREYCGCGETSQTTFKALLYCAQNNHQFVNKPDFDKRRSYLTQNNRQFVHKPDFDKTRPDSPQNNRQFVHKSDFDTKQDRMISYQSHHAASQNQRLLRCHCWV